MNCDQVTRRQARTIRARVAEMRMYFCRLRTRMTHRGFLAEDPLFVLVQTAEQAIDELYVPSICAKPNKRPGSNNAPLASGTIGGDA
jgi:hypothetical protein